MTERLTMKTLSDELQELRTRMLELEQRLQDKIEARLEGILASAETGTRTGDTPGHQSGIDAEHRQRLIAEEAYMIAERRGFREGDPGQDWAEAEKLVDNRLMQPAKPEQPAKPRQSAKPRQPAIRTSRPRKKTANTTKKSTIRKKAGSKVSGTAKQ